MTSLRVCFKTSYLKTIEKIFINFIQSPTFFITFINSFTWFIECIFIFYGSFVKEKNRIYCSQESSIIRSSGILSYILLRKCLFLYIKKSVNTFCSKLLKSCRISDLHKEMAIPKFCCKVC